MLWFSSINTIHQYFLDKKQSSVLSNPSAFLYDTVLRLIDEHTEFHDTTIFDLFAATFEAQEEDGDSAASTLTDRLRQRKDEITRQIDTIEQPFEQLDELTPYARSVRSYQGGY